MESDFGMDPFIRRRRKRDLIWLAAIVLLLAGEGALVYWWVVERAHDFHPSPYPKPLDPYILAAGERYDVSPALIRAVIWKESRFNEFARGKSGEIGLMQLMGPAAQEWAEAEKVDHFTHEHVADAGTNVLAGTWYLKKMLKLHQDTDNPLPYALAAYNAGRRNVLRWNQGPAETNSAAFYRNIDFPTTRQYVLDVMECFAYYRTNSLPRRSRPAPINRE